MMEEADESYVEFDASKLCEYKRMLYEIRKISPDGLWIEYFKRKQNVLKSGEK